jgi:ubiquinone/menaquinone biosynthesis C-methylase UbiE
MQDQRGKPAVGSVKAAVQAYWDTKPCGSGEPPGKAAPAEFFQAHAQIRYEREPEIAAFAEFHRWSKQRVLEIGAGMGADYVRFLKAGARAIGLDLSRRSVELARENAATNGVAASLLNADAEALPFQDCAFDLVYSWGVLHHSPDIERTVSEAHRVLRQGGECRAMLYHRRSLVGLQCYLRYGLARLRPFSRLSELISAHVESPGTKAYSLSEARKLFRKFKAVKIEPVATPYDLRFGRRHFAPRWMLRWVPDRLGWFLLIRARK